MDAAADDDDDDDDDDVSSFIFLTFLKVKSLKIG